MPVFINVTSNSWNYAAGQVGHIARPDKRGKIDDTLPPILQRLNIDTDTWLFMATQFEDSNGPWVGPDENLAKVCKRTQKKWICNTPIHQKLHPT